VTRGSNFFAAEATRSSGSRSGAWAYGQRVRQGLWTILRDNRCISPRHCGQKATCSNKRIVRRTIRLGRLRAQHWRTDYWSDWATGRRPAPTRNGPGGLADRLDHSV